MAALWAVVGLACPLVWPPSTRSQGQRGGLVGGEDPPSQALPDVVSRELSDLVSRKWVQEVVELDLGACNPADHSGNPSLALQAGRAALKPDLYASPSKSCRGSPVGGSFKSGFPCGLRGLFQVCANHGSLGVVWLLWDWKNGWGTG